MLPRIQPRCHVNPHIPIPDLERIRADIVGPLIERSAGAKVEPGMMPVTGQNSISDTAAIEWETHMRTAIVDGMQAILVSYDRERVSVHLHDGAAAGFYGRERSRPNPMLPRMCHFTNSSPDCAVRSGVDYPSSTDRASQMAGLQQRKETRQVCGSTLNIGNRAQMHVNLSAQMLDLRTTLETVSLLGRFHGQSYHRVSDVARRRVYGTNSLCHQRDSYLSRLMPETARRLDEAF